MRDRKLNKHDPKTPPIYISCVVDEEAHRFMFVPDLEDGERLIWHAADGTCTIRENNRGGWDAIGITAGGSAQTVTGESAEDAAQRWVDAFVDEAPGNRNATKGAQRAD